MITTDRRAYYIRLISKPEDYVARVAFAYPEDENSRKVVNSNRQSSRALDRSKKNMQAEVPPAVLLVEKVNFDYTVHRR